MTFVVAGGGFAGVETIAGINDFVRDALRSYPRLAREGVRMVLVHAGRTMLPELGEKLGAYAQRKLTERGIEIQTNAKVERVTDEAVTLSDGAVLPARRRLDRRHVAAPAASAAAVQARSRPRLRQRDSGGRGLARRLGARGLRARPERQDRQVPAADGAARAARRHRRRAATSWRRIRGGRKVPFAFGGPRPARRHRSPHRRRAGSSASTFSGFFAWWLWRTIYLSKLPRFEKKVRVAMNWTLDSSSAKISCST